MITEEWLKENGFKWHEVERSGKHWILWIGSAIAQGERGYGRTSSYDDFGIEISKFNEKEEIWSCFFRADYAGRYTRFIYCRDMWEPEHVTQLIEALTGFPFDKECVMYGFYHQPEHAARIREIEQKRLDQRIAHGNRWRTDEPDETKAVRK